MWRIAPEQQAAKSDDAEVARDQQRDTQPEHQLGDLDRGVAKMPALVERPEPEQKMDRGGGVKRKIDDRSSPPPDMEAQPGFHGVVGDIAERMVEEMREDVGEHHQAASQ